MIVGYRTPSNFHVSLPVQVHSPSMTYQFRIPQYLYPDLYGLGVMMTEIVFLIMIAISPIFSYSTRDAISMLATKFPGLETFPKSPSVSILIFEGVMPG